MNDENIIYLDSLIAENKVQTIIFILQSILFFISGILNIKNDHWFGYLSISFAAFIVIIIIFQIIFFKKFDRKYVKFTEYGLEYKNSYFKERKSIKWSEIKKIKFSGKDNIITFKSSDKTSINIPATLNKYNLIRSEFKKYINQTDIILEC